MAKSTIRGKTFCQLFYLLDRKAAEKRFFYAPQQTVEPTLQSAFPGLENDVQLPFLVTAENHGATVLRGFCATVSGGFCAAGLRGFRAHSSSSSPSWAVRISSAPVP